MSIAAPGFERHPPRSAYVQDRNLDLVVTWQHPVTRATTPIGLLSQEVDGYLFRYLQRAVSVDGFRALISFPDLDRTYRSRELFPLFAQRAMEDPRRRDYRNYLAHLGLLEDASPWDQIVRSSGDSAGDTIKVSPMPVLIDGSWYCVSTVAGIKYMTSKSVDVDGQTRGPHTWEDLARRLSHLGIGEQVRLIHESSNLFSDAATLVATLDGEPFGYLPDWLAHMVLPYLEQDASVALIDQAIEVDERWYVRVLIRLDGRVGASLESLLGPGWETFRE